MLPTENGFEKLIERVRGGEMEPSRAREALEDNLTPLVRRVLRTGRGPSVIVSWIEQARVRMGEALASLNVEAASRCLGRMLCTAMLDRYTPRTGKTIAAWETVAG